MTRAVLFDQLEKLVPYRVVRERIGHEALKNGLVKELIQFAHHESKVSHQACWCLEFSYFKDTSCIYPFIDDFCVLFTTPINSSGMRSLTKMGAHMIKSYYSKRTHPIQQVLTVEHRECILNGCFDQVIHLDKTANLVFSINSLYELGKEFDWIHEQLAQLLEKKLHAPHTKGFYSIATKTLEKLKR
jgi:hypothetical protein